MRQSFVITMCLMLLGSALSHADEPPPVAPTVQEPASALDLALKQLGLELGILEKQALERTLTERGMAIETEPAGRRLCRVHVRNVDVFDEEDGSFLQWFNLFHRVTAEDVIERELVIGPGDSWDRALVDESVRNLQDPVYSNIVIAVPVKPTGTECAPGVGGENTASPRSGVDLLVITRDVWSLRFNSNVQFQGDALTLLSLSLAENNFLGWRKQMNVFFNMDLGAFEVGPSYTDPNIMGTHLTFSSQASALFGRDSGEFEGSRSKTTFAYPLWSLSQRFGASVTVSHYDSVVRRFLGSTLRTYDAPATEEDDVLPWKYRYTLVDGAVTGYASFGTKVKQRVSVGYEAYTVTTELTDDLAAEGRARRQFEAALLPRSEVSSAIALSYSVFTPTYETFRDLATYDLREDYRVGPSFSYSLRQGLTALGSDRDYTRLGASLGYTAGVRGAYLEGTVSWSARLQDDDLLDHQSTVATYLTTPMLWRAFRLVTRADLSVWLSGENQGYYTVGGDNGLRGFPVDQFSGPTRLRVNVEARSVPFRLYALRIGGVVFWDLGGVGDEVASLDTYHDTGLGLRVLIPQFNTYVFRVDWAFALNGPGSGSYGRVSFGFLQAF